MRVAVLTVSDAGSRGERKDTSGDAAVAWASARGYTLAERALVPDDSHEIVRALLRWCDGGVVDLVLTTGGTGLSPRDVTPEATRAVIEREAPGFAELMRASVLVAFPQAALSRATAGVRGRTLVVNLPGSTGGVKDGLKALEPIIDHAVATVRGDPDVHCAVCTDKA
ncbi:MAG TPA: MogA/MoaB family molybdenum cofactor biosynthesis protein [Gemmatimonadaceae bacterium]|jgi:molybdenum cofactor synthesis domain-containing protein|nr:MogA/MoaB family molybdenum cofactor biosynthesis protein [Gemmatimonadaceae bacterium]